MLLERRHRGEDEPGVQSMGSVTIMNDPSPTSLEGLRVAIFEARMAGALADLVARHGGVPVAAPALREVPLGDNPDALAFASSLIAGSFDVVIFETG
ncbi:MAG: hypothetical protein JO114_17630, partial [Planctomycetaceae bacterium]|nr:hypothetical protein [Planctomycetaceae bacterium]